MCATYTVAGVNVVVSVFVPAIFRYELQKLVAGGPSFLRTLRAPVTLEQSMARWSSCAAGVGSGQAAPSAVKTAATKRLVATIFVAGGSRGQIDEMFRT